jgi:hypothetical protein
MNIELSNYADSGNLEGVKRLVEAGANIEETFEGQTVLTMACLHGHSDFVVYLVEHGANVAHTDGEGMTPLHCASMDGDLSSVKYLLEHGARITERSGDGKTSLHYAATYGKLNVVQYLLSLECGAKITETDNDGCTALSRAACYCNPPVLQLLIEYGGAQITDTDNAGDSVWSGYHAGYEKYSLPAVLRCAYSKSADGEYVPVRNTAALLSMLRVMLLHGGPPASLTADLAPPLQRIVEDGVRLRARLPAYLAQRRALLEAHCPLLPPLQALVHGYETPTTTDELWATGLGAPLQRAKRSRPKKGRPPERRSARLRQKRE